MMRKHEGIEWRRLGAPDFAQVGYWFHRLAPEMRNRCNRSEEKTLIHVIFYTWVQAHRSGRSTHYCSFSQAKLGERIGRSRWTIARALDALERRGWLSRVHRRPRPGEEWQTNLYMLCGQLLKALTAIIMQVRKKSPCSKSATQESSKILIESGPDPSLEGPGPSALENFSAEKAAGWSHETRSEVAKWFSRFRTP